MSSHIESHLVENRVFKPSKSFAKRALISDFDEYEELYRKSIKNTEKFWGQQAEEVLVRHKKWDEVLKWNVRFAEWFVGGKLNVAENCLDRHLEGPRCNKAAIIWEGEPGEKRTLTYKQLHREVCKFANVLRASQIDKGDRILIYMPICPETAVAMLACPRIAAIHSVVFGFFNSAAIMDRIDDT